MAKPGGIVPPNLVPRLLIDLRTNMNPLGRKTTNLSNKVDMCEWINYWMENGCITGGNGDFVLYAESGLHKKDSDSSLASDADTVHLGGTLIENTSIDGDSNSYGLGLNNLATVQIDSSGTTAFGLPSLDIINTPLVGASTGISINTDGRVNIGSTFASNEAMLQVKGIGTIDPLRVVTVGNTTTIQVEDNGDLIFRPRLTGAGTINYVLTNSDGFGRVEWASPGVLFTGGSGIDISGSTLNWDGDLTQNVAINGLLHAHGIAFNAIDHFVVDTDSGAGISLTQGSVNPGPITISNTSPNSHVTISSTNGGNVILDSTSGEYELTTAPTTDNTVTNIVGLNGSNQLKLRSLNNLVTQETLTGGGGGAQALTIPTGSIEHTVFKSAIDPGDDITFPDASAVSTQLQITVKDIEFDATATPFTITPAAGTIEGGANFPMDADGKSATFKNNGTNWYLI